MFLQLPFRSIYLIQFRQQKQNIQFQSNYSLIKQFQINHLPMQQSAQPHSQNRYRSKEHEALIKLKNAQKNMEMMQRRFKYLQVKDQQNRSKTIQHEKKLELYSLHRQQIKRQKSRLTKQQIKRLKQIEVIKQKNQQIKEVVQESIKQAKEKVIHQKLQEYKIVKEQHQVNQKIVEKFKEKQIQQKQIRRKNINQQQQQQKLRISRYNEVKRNQTLNAKSMDSSRISSMADNLQKQLQKLSKIQESMIKKSSQSLQASQIVRNRLRQVLGDERRFTKLPQIKNRNYSTRGSTGNTHIISI